MEVRKIYLKLVVQSEMEVTANKLFDTNKDH